MWELRGVTVDVRNAGGESIRNEGALRTLGPAQTQGSVDPLRVLVNQVPALFWTTDVDLVLTSSLGAEFERLGIGPNQLVGTALGELFEADEDHELMEAHRVALAGSSVRFQAKWARRKFRARVAPLRDSDDLVIGTICVALEDGAARRGQSRVRVAMTA